MAERSYRALLWAVVLLGITLDQASKYGVFHWLYNEGEGSEYVLVPGAFKLVAEFKRDAPSDSMDVAQPRVNEGALFGMGREYKGLANNVFALVSLLAAVAIIGWSLRGTTARDPFLCAALGLILAGTLGNLYDRLIFHGVRDFLYFHWINWPVFNVADCCLVCGAFLLLTQAFWNRPAHAPREGAETALAFSESSHRS
jgi:lipoprotein signal peptidase